MLNILRSPAAGRSLEDFGADPYLMGQFAAHTVRGIQDQGVMAEAKNLAVNSQEHGRYDSSSDVDDSAFCEIYLPDFEHTIKAGVGSVMCAYNVINGTFACENQRVFGDILKGELDFQGWVVTDVVAADDIDKTFIAGSDVILGGAVNHHLGSKVTSFFGAGPGFGSDIAPFIEDGAVPLARVDDAAARILSTWYKFGQDKSSQYRPVPSGAYRDVQAGAATRAKIREIGAAGTVLLKKLAPHPAAPQATRARRLPPRRRRRPARRQPLLGRGLR